MGILSSFSARRTKNVFYECAKCQTGGEINMAMLCLCFR